MDKNTNDILVWIEQQLPERFELLLRTNRDYDGKSGVHGGMWYLHLTECIPDSNNSFTYKSWYSECSDDLYYLLNNVIVIIKYKL